MMLFQKAVPVWGASPKNKWNQFFGFRTDLELSGPAEVEFAIAARSHYRLYLNGQIAAHGPAQAAQGHCRVDRHLRHLEGRVAVAIEVFAEKKPNPYANNCTLEPGLLACEITTAGQILAYTGDESWRCRELTHRASLAEYMSHSRGILEDVTLDAHTLGWMTDNLPERPIPTGEAVQFLPRRAPYATLRPIPMQKLLRVMDVVPDESQKAPFSLSPMLHPKWYEMLPGENRLFPGLYLEREAAFSGRYATENERVSLEPGEYPAALLWALDKSEVGFLHLQVEVQGETVLDVLHSDHLENDGSLPANTYLTRYRLQPGRYDLTTFEPKLVRFVKCVLRTRQPVTICRPEVLDDTYPDDRQNTFLCSDAELNAVYEAALRTLRLNTLDIFMDCPERERGGWLCDSTWTARAAWALLGDLSVERDFLENFLCTCADRYDHAWFPEVYPGTRTGTSPGTTSWAMWLLIELAEYCARSGDHSLIQRHKERLTAWIEGLFRDYYDEESGLFCRFESTLIDWSLSNRPFACGPISVPTNALICKALIELAQVCNEPSWAERAEKVLGVLKQACAEDDMTRLFRGCYLPDALRHDKGVFSDTSIVTEAALAIDLWCGFGTEREELVREFLDTMGPTPRRTPNPYVGRANLFIGLMVRFDVLSQMGRVDQLLQELKAVYLPQLREGCGTLFEHSQHTNGCHGFNSHAGALIVRHVLGLGDVCQQSQTVRLMPHPGDVQWAAGQAQTCDGPIDVSWHADREDCVLHLTCRLPEGWTAAMEAPKGWTMLVNGKEP